jgi:hypothetical protein
MNELIKVLRHFITRDMIYIIGGTSIVLSFLHIWDALSILTPVTLIHWIGLGFAWVIGYLIQEFFSPLQVVTTKPRSDPPDVMKWLYNLFQHKRWENIGTFDFEEARIGIYENASDRNIARLQRIITLKQAWTTMGSCSLISGIILIIKSAISKAPIDVTLAIVVPILGIIFIGIGWIKVGEEMQYIRLLSSQINEVKK